jgi:2-polyprenyl-3-methyl-5-hydroxy-6-metoxy-1,4-benzoquinol methylase
LYHKRSGIRMPVEIKQGKSMQNQGELRFSFGANWQSYVDRSLTTRRVARAATSVQELLGVEHLVGRTFLDVGCGSGLFSLAARLLGAAHVTSFDFDPQSIRATEVLRERSGAGEDRWSVFEGSILDETLVAHLEPADVVYSWGVLHHTGSMWRAIDNTARLVRPGGLLALAIYNQQDRAIGGSAMWWHIKRAYNRVPQAARTVMEGTYALALAATDLARTGDPLHTYRHYRSESRGMDYWHDVRDWLGGYPYEYATVDAVVDHLQRLEFETIFHKQSAGVGCNEYVFRYRRRCEAI